MIKSGAELQATEGERLLHEWRAATLAVREAAQWAGDAKVALEEANQRESRARMALWDWAKR